VQMKCDLVLEKETKGAVRYKEKGEPVGQLLKTMYIRKSAFQKGETYPKEIRVGIESVE